uniref:Uncharacterized protein n=1 Tax=Zooxanthella nutricula TaxID=1333877 RepID=A0A6U6X975_9DINO
MAAAGAMGSLARLCLVAFASLVRGGASVRALAVSGEAALAARFPSSAGGSHSLAQVVTLAPAPTNDGSAVTFGQGRTPRPKGQPRGILKRSSFVVDSSDISNIQIPQQPGKEQQLMQEKDKARSAGQSGLIIENNIQARLQQEKDSLQKMIDAYCENLRNTKESTAFKGFRICVKILIPFFIVVLLFLLFLFVQLLSMGKDFKF